MTTARNTESEASESVINARLQKSVDEIKKMRRVISFVFAFFLTLGITLFLIDLFKKIRNED